MTRCRHVCYSFILPFIAEADGILQAASWEGMPNIGFPLLTHQ